MKGSSLPGMVDDLSPLEEMGPKSGCEGSSLRFLDGGSEVGSGVSRLELMGANWGEYVNPFSSGMGSSIVCAPRGIFLMRTAMKNPPVSCKCGYIRIHRDNCRLIPSSSFVGENIVSVTFPPATISVRSISSPFASNTFHDCIPGRLTSWGNSSETSTTSTAPFVNRKISATTASFSNGFNEHVEYTNRPFTASICNPRYKIRICKGCKPTADLFVQFFQINSFLRKVPSPEQGTSAKTRSNFRISSFPPSPGIRKFGNIDAS